MNELASTHSDHSDSIPVDLVDASQKPRTLSLEVQREIFMREINGGGLRWEFDLSAPNTTKGDQSDDILGLYQKSVVFQRHVSDPESFEARVERFGKYVESVESQVGEKVEQELYVGNETRKVSRHIPENLVDKYHLFYDALGEYTEGLYLYRAGEISIGEFSDLASAVMRIVRPPQKDGEQKYDPGISDTSVRWFLEAKMFNRSVDATS